MYDCLQYVDVLQVEGMLVLVQKFELVVSVQMVCVCQGQLWIIDGFFVEICELLVGFNLINVFDCDVVMCIVQQFLWLCFGSIEVWLLVDMDVECECVGV